MADFEQEFKNWKSDYEWWKSSGEEEMMKVYVRLREIGLSEKEVQDLVGTVEAVTAAEYGN